MLLWGFSVVHAELVQEVKVVNLFRADKAIVLDAFADFEQQEMEAVQPQISQAVKRLYRTGYFSDINVDFEQGVLIVELYERPVVTDIVVDTVADDTEIEEDLNRLINQYFFIGNNFNESLIGVLQRNLKAFYRSLGYYNPQIKLTPQVLPLNRVRLEVKIDRGTLSRVQDIVISGLKVFSEREIEEMFDFEETDFIAHLLDSDVFSPEQLSGGLERIRAFYFDRGYLDFEVKSYSWVYSPLSGNFVVYVHLEEGQKYVVNSVYFLNALKRNEKVFRPLVQIKPGDSYRNTRLTAMVADIQNLYQNFGYSYGQVEHKVQKNSEQGTVDIFLSVDAQLLSHVYRIDFVGNAKTYDFVLRQEMMLTEGQVFSRSALDQSLNKIRALGFFDTVSYQIKSVKDTSLVDLNILVQEKESTGKWSLGATHNSEDGWLYNISFEQNNFLGKGDDLDLVLNRAFDGSDGKFVVRYHDRRFGGTQANLTPAFTYEKTSEDDGYNQEYYSGSVAYTRPAGFDENAIFSIKPSGAKHTLECKEAFAEEEPQCGKTSINIYSVLGSYVFSSLEGGDFTNKGSYLGVSVGYTFGDFQYFSADLNFKNYIAFDSITLKTHFLVKAAFAKLEEVPFFNRYTLDSGFTVRGFDKNKFADRYTSFDRSKGGNLVTGLKLELAYNPKDLLGIDGLRLATFVDTGYVFPTVDDFEISKIRSSVGVALHWFSPFGALGIYKAWPLHKEDADVFDETISLSLGNSF